jgi:hypothetical protein
MLRGGEFTRFFTEGHAPGFCASAQSFLFHFSFLGTPIEMIVDGEIEGMIYVK